MNDDTEIRDLVDERAAAMRRGDAAAVIAQYLPGAVVYNLAPPLRQPAEAVDDVAGLQAWFDGKGGSVHSQVRDVEVTVGGDVAYVTALECMGAPPHAPQQFTLWFRTTLGLRRVDGAWRIAHGHTSTPFHMDGSNRAALDLQP